MRVLGVDPGTGTTGYGIVADGERHSLECCAYGAIATPSQEPLERRLARIYEAVSDLLERYRPDVVAVEELFFKQNVTTGIAVAQARGVVLLAAAHAGRPVVHYKPAEVKQAVVGIGNASKRQVRFMTKTLLGLSQLPQPDDAADGLAVAICHLHRAPARARVVHAAAGGRSR